MRRWLVVGLVAAALLSTLVGLLVGIQVVAWPTSVAVEEADAVAVHAPGVDRLVAGVELVEASGAPVLVISDVASAYRRTEEEMAALCRRRKPYEVVCVPPAPVNTLGEARAFGRLAEARGWRSLAVVTDRAHLARARFSVRQCTGAEVLPVATDPDASPQAAEVVGELLRLIATKTLWRACY